MSGSDITDQDKVRLRAVFVPDGQHVDGKLLEGFSDPVILRARLTMDEDDDTGSDAASE